MATSKKTANEREGIQKATVQKGAQKGSREAALPQGQPSAPGAPPAPQPAASPSYVQGRVQQGAAASISGVISGVTTPTIAPTVPPLAGQPVVPPAHGRSAPGGAKAGKSGASRSGKSARGATATATGTQKTTPPASARTDPTSPTSTAGAGMPIDETGIPELERVKSVGDTLNGRFVLEECIGFGGMGTVYKALDLRKLEASDRRPYIAIKVLNVQFRGHPKSLIALQREARKAQALAHPNIVAVYDFDRDGSMVYLTMEYLVGEPLSRILQAPQFAGLPLEDALPIVAGIAQALAYAHQRGFVHCDLKPANVFLTERGDVKVIDFGIARVFQKPDEDQQDTVFDAGSLGGLTPAYASAEMLEHREPDPRDDIYALACITHELLTGRHPFNRMSATQARGSGMKPIRPKNLSHRQWRALRSALSFERETRMPSALRFLDDLSDQRRVAVNIAVSVAVVLALALVTLATIRYRSAAFAPGPDTVSQERTTTPTPPGKAPVGTAAETPQSDAGRPAARAASVALTMAAVTPALAGVPCSALHATIRQHNLQVQGYMSRAYGLSRLKSTLGTIPGVDTMNLDVRPVEDDECSVVTAFAPYWLRNRQAGTASTIRTRAVDGLLTEGDPLLVDVTTPPYDTWVHVDYFVRDGGVAHLLPSVRARDNQAPPSYSATIGGLGNWIIGKPFGAELIVLLTTPAPLFQGLRPEYETTADYLRAVDKQLRQFSAHYGPDRILVDFVQINTKARKP